MAMTRIDKLSGRSKCTVSVFRTYKVASAFMAWLQENTTGSYRLVTSLK